MVNDDTTESIVNPGETLRSIRSHRREPDRTYRKPFLTLFVLMVCSPMLVTSVLPGSAKPEHHAAVPASTPLNGPVKPIRDLSRPDLVPPTNPTTTAAQARSERASRTETRKPADPPIPSKVEVVIAFALSQQGKPYSFGTSGPRAYDCSGLVKRAFAQIGMELYHYTGRMMGYGQRVARNSLQRGDIVFPTSGHVGIYLGNNSFVHASSGKGKVVVASLYGFYTARRLT